MMQNLKYGILTGGGYIVAAAAIALLACIINSAAGEYNALFLSTPYYIFGGTGLTCSNSLWGYLSNIAIPKYAEVHGRIP